MDMILKAILAAFWLILVPGLAGIILMRKKAENTLAECFLAGYILLFSLAEILTLPMIVLDLPLHILTMAYGAIAGLLALWGAVCYGKRIRTNGISSVVHVPRFSVYFWMAVVVILLQAVMCVMMAHMDADDSFYVAAATTSVHTDTIFSVNPYTGLEFRWPEKRYILSPFPVFLAVVSQLSGGLHPAIMAHTIYPAIFLPMAYMVMYYIGKKWFSGNKQAQGIFLFIAAVMTSFSAYSVYNAGNFQLVRIWQGKAFLAAIMLPLLFYFCYTILLPEKEEYPWIFLFMTNLSCCFLSSMGIMLAPLMMGCFLVIAFAKGKRPGQLFKGLCCCLPSIVLGVVYIML